MESSCKIKWMGSSWIAVTNYGWWWRHESQQTGSLLYPSTNLTCWMMSLLRDSASDSAGFCWLILWLLWLLGLLPLLTALAGPDSPSAHPGFQSSPGAAACVWGSQRRVIGSQKQNLAAWPCRDGRECQKPSFVPRIGKHITIDYWPNPPIPSVKSLNCIQLSWSSKYKFENKIKIKTIETLSCFRDMFQSVYHSLPLWCHHQLFALASPLVAMSQWRTWYVDCVGSWCWRAIKIGRSWGRMVTMVTVLARILRIWGSKPDGQEMTRNDKNAQDLCHGPWSFKLICVCELWSSHLKWMDSFIMSYLHRNDIQTISKPSLWGGLTTTHKRETTNPPARLRHQPMSSMRSASSKTRQDTWDRFVHGMPLWDVCLLEPSFHAFRAWNLRSNPKIEVPEIIWPSDGRSPLKCPIKRCQANANVSW